MITRTFSTPVLNCYAARCPTYKPTQRSVPSHPSSPPSCACDSSFTTNTIVYIYNYSFFILTISTATDFSGFYIELSSLRNDYKLNILSISDGSGLIISCRQVERRIFTRSREWLQHSMNRCFTVIGTLVPPSQKWYLSDFHGCTHFYIVITNVYK